MKTAESPLTGTEAASLRQLLCGMTPGQWRTHVTGHNIRVLVTEYLSRLQCQVSDDTADHLASLLTAEDMYGPPDTWSTSDMLSVGWLASTLTPDQLASVPAHAMEGLTGDAVNYFTGNFVLLIILVTLHLVFGLFNK